MSERAERHALIERLRERADRSYGNGLLREAADALAAADTDLQALQQDYEAVEQLVASLTRERQQMIEPLKQSDDPEEADAVRITPDYVLMTRKAWEQELAINVKRDRERQQLREALEQIEGLCAGVDPVMEHIASTALASSSPGQEKTLERNAGQREQIQGIALDAIEPIEWSSVDSFRDVLPGLKMTGPMEITGYWAANDDPPKEYSVKLCDGCTAKIREALEE